MRGRRSLRARVGPLRYVRSGPLAPANASAGAPRWLWAGTEPSALYRSEDGGRTWEERPWTHHARWIEPDPWVAGRLCVAIELGGVMRSSDGGRTWEDRKPHARRDAHTPRTHSQAAGRVYQAAGDGYAETMDAGVSWREGDEGLAAQPHTTSGDWRSTRATRTRWWCRLRPDRGMRMTCTGRRGIGTSHPASPHNAASLRPRRRPRGGGMARRPPCTAGRAWGSGRLSATGCRPPGNPGRCVDDQCGRATHVLCGAVARRRLPIHRRRHVLGALAGRVARGVRHRARAGPRRGTGSLSVRQAQSPRPARHRAPALPRHGARPDCPPPGMPPLGIDASEGKACGQFRQRPDERGLRLAIPVSPADSTHTK